MTKLYRQTRLLHITLRKVSEFTSKKTRKEDEGDKFTIYEQVIEVPEYILFDPKGDYLTPRLKGYRLNASGKYEPIEPDENGRLYSVQLDMFMEVEGTLLRLIDARTGEYLLTPLEESKQRQQEKRRANDEARRAAQETQKRRQAELRADVEARARQDEKRRADEAEARAASLLAELQALRRERNG